MVSALAGGVSRQGALRPGRVAQQRRREFLDNRRRENDRVDNKSHSRVSHSVVREVVEVYEQRCPKNLYGMAQASNSVLAQLGGGNDCGNDGDFLFRYVLRNQVD